MKDLLQAQGNLNAISGANPAQIALGAASRQTPGRAHERDTALVAILPGIWGCAFPAATERGKAAVTPHSTDLRARHPPAPSPLSSLLSPSSGDPPSPSSRAPNQPPAPAQRDAPWRTVRSIREKNRGNLGTERITEKDGGNVGTQRRWGRRTGGHGEEASYSDKLFHLSQTACGEPQCNGDSSNACAPGQAGRKKYCQCHGTEQTQDRAFLRAPLGFPREGTVRFCGAL